MNFDTIQHLDIGHKMISILSKNMMRNKFIIIGLATISLISACNKDLTCIAPAFEGTISSDQEVDLGLSAKWAGYNMGATCPQDYGNHYAWGEVSVKTKYLDENYTKPSADILPYDNDVASKEWGYGWHMPSVENIQELIDNCDISFVSYKGVDGWAATSKVPGYEGKTIFFPASGYRAGENWNYRGSQCVFWSNSLVSSGASHAINAFFDGTSLKLNAPPRGKGGTLWCGYAIRPVRQFFLDIDTEDISCNRDVPYITFNVSGNARWTASVTGEGASISPQYGEGPGAITVTLPQNDTEDNKYYNVSVASDEISETRGFTITQFGVIPEFSIKGDKETTIVWDYDEPIKFSLAASASVSWSASVVMNGEVLEDATVTPESGSGSSEISVRLPNYLDPLKDGQCEIIISTDNDRIPEEISNITYKVNRLRCQNIPFGFSWGTDFLSALTTEFNANKTASSYTVHNTTITPATAGAMTTSGYLGKNLTLTFNSAESGNAILHVKASVASKGSSAKKINIYLNSTLVHSFANNTSAAITVDDDVAISNIQKGDMIKITMSDSNNHKLYSMSYKKAL